MSQDKISKTVNDLCKDSGSKKEMGNAVLKGILRGAAIVILGSMALISCSSPADKAKKIEEALPANGGVIYRQLDGENPQLITYTVDPDSTTVVWVHNLKSNQVDTLIHLKSGYSLAEAIPIDDGYVYINKESRADGNEHYIYTAGIVRNIDNAQKKTRTYLPVVSTREEIGASSYVIDREGNKITLSSYEVTPTQVEIYHTVYDFNGNRILEDPVHINIPQPQVAQSVSSSAVYLWECDKCGMRVNSGKKPSPFYTRAGDSCFHEWVNMGRVN